MSVVETHHQVEPVPENYRRIVWQLAWPAVALNSLQVVNNLLDRGFIGHLQAAALTAQSASMNVVFLMFSLAMSLGTAATAIVARAFGAKQAQECKEAARQSVGLAIAFGFGLSAIGLMVHPYLIQMLLPSSDQQAMLLMKQYLDAYALGLPAIFVIQTLAGSLRGVGDTKSPMIISGIQILLHIALNWILIFPPKHLAAGITVPGFDLGLKGASLAMALSAWMAAIGYLAYSGRTPLGQCWRLSFPTYAWAVRVLRIAMPTAIMSVLRVASFAAFTIVLAQVPDASMAIAATGVGFAIESIMFMPAFGLSMATSALVGQSLGMGKPERAERITWVAGHNGAIVIAALSVPIFIFAPNFVPYLVADKPEIVHQSVSLIRFLAATEVLFGYAMVLIGAMQGAGDTKNPMWISVLCMWGIRVPLTYALALPFAFGAGGAWASMSITQAIHGLVTIFVFKQGAWKSQQV